jgi:hypothetical protein
LAALSPPPSPSDVRFVFQIPLANSKRFACQRQRSGILELYLVTNGFSMSLIPDSVVRSLAAIRAAFTVEQAAARLEPRFAAPSWKIRPSRATGPSTVARLWETLAAAGVADAAMRAAISDAGAASVEAFGRNIENMVGTVKTPVGVVGPLRVNGVNAHGDYCVPMATTEAALVASYGRGAEVVTAAGGAAAALLSEGVLRTPGFARLRLRQPRGVRPLRRVGRGERRRAARGGRSDDPARADGLR